MIITQDVKNYINSYGVPVNRSKEEMIALIQEGLGARGYTIIKLTKIKGGYRFYLETPKQ